MIENKIDELIAAIDRLTAAMTAQPTSKPEKIVSVSVGAPPVAPEPETEPASNWKVVELTAADKIADMENRCRALARKDPKTMRVAILELLESYGSKTIKGVPEGKLDELSAKLAELEG